MTVVSQFVIYNLLASLFAGGIVWLVVTVIVVLLNVRPITIKLSFLALPLIKSSFILLGIGYVFPWPMSIFAGWRKEALSPLQVLPVWLLWTIIALSIYAALVLRARRLVLSDVKPASQAAPRLEAVFERVLVAYRQVSLQECSNGMCCVVADVPQLNLLVSDGLASPVALTEGGRPAIVFPSGLLSQLDDGELAGALAHEFGHFTLRRPAWSSAATLRKLTLVNPVAGLLASNLSREEEMACDEIAVAALGRPEEYASMLLKSYRFVSEKPASTLAGRLRIVPELFGFKPTLRNRVQSLLHPKPQTGVCRQNHTVFGVILALLVLLFFFTPW